MKNFISLISDLSLRLELVIENALNNLFAFISLSLKFQIFYFTYVSLSVKSNFFHLQLVFIENYK